MATMKCRHIAIDEPFVGNADELGSLDRVNNTDDTDNDQGSNTADNNRAKLHLLSISSLLIFIFDFYLKCSTLIRTLDSSCSCVYMKADCHGR